MGEYDVIIVGGRVAGCATALMLAEAGARVLVLERNRMPSAPVSVPVIFANALAIFERLGLREAIEASGATKMHSGGARIGDIELRLPVKPYAGIDYHLGLRREALDGLLIEHASRHPRIELRTGWTVDQLLRQGERVTGVRGRAGGGPSAELRAALVVGADGRASRVAREVGAGQYRVKRGQNCVYYAYYRGFRSRGEPMTFSYRGEGASMLMFEAEDGLTAISLGARPEAWETFRGDPTGEFERRWRTIPELAELGEHAVRVTPVRGHGPLDSFYRQPFGPGWALAGDAGFYKDPCTGQGIYDALRSAELLTSSWTAWRAGEEYGRAMGRYQRTRDRESRLFYAMAYQASKIPSGAQPNLPERLLFNDLARDIEYAAELAGIYNGASRLEEYSGIRGGIRFVARALMRPLALRWAASA